MLTVAGFEVYAAVEKFTVVEPEALLPGTTIDAEYQAPGATPEAPEVDHQNVDCVSAGLVYEVEE